MRPRLVEGTVRGELTDGEVVLSVGGGERALILNAVGDAVIELCDGSRTIAEIAADKNVSTETIVAAIVAAQKEALDAAVTAGALTQDQADAHLADFQTHAQDLLDQTMTGRGPSGRGPGGFDGPGMGGQGDGFGGRRGPGNGFGGRGPGGMGGQNGQGGPGNAPAPESTTTPNA